jgi:hypothetical protein
MSRSESAVQAAARVRASQLGMRVWRNNVGALQDATGRVVRYGLANESAAMNDRIKSGDLIGVRPVLITADMVGTTIGQFVSIECKAEDWRPDNSERTQAQIKWLQLVQALGGHAVMITDEGQL